MLAPREGCRLGGKGGRAFRSRDSSARRVLLKRHAYERKNDDASPHPPPPVPPGRRCRRAGGRRFRRTDRLRQRHQRPQREPDERQRLRPDHRRRSGGRRRGHPGEPLGRRDQASRNAEDGWLRRRTPVQHEGPGHRQADRLRRRAGPAAVALHHRQGRRTDRAHHQHRRHPRDAGAERDGGRRRGHLLDHPGAGEEGGVRRSVLPLRRCGDDQGRHHRHRRESRTSTARRSPPSRAPPRPTGSPRSRPVPRSACSPTTPSASPPSRPIGWTRTCWIRAS